MPRPLFITLFLLCLLPSAALQPAAAQTNLPAKTAWPSATPPQNTWQPDIKTPEAPDARPVIRPTTIPANGLFRGFVWGVSREEVRRFETAQFFEEVEGSLFFIDQADGFRTLIRYDFEDNKLWHARFEYVDAYFPRFPDAMDFLITIEMRLNDTFGTPLQEQLIWRNNQFRNFPDQWGSAVMNGHLDLKVTWEALNTHVALTAFARNLDLKVTYDLEQTGTRNRITMDKERSLLRIP